MTLLCYANVILAFSTAMWWVSAEIGENLLIFGLGYLVNGSKTRWCLLLFWCLCLTASVIFVGSTEGRRLGTVHRKFFHLTVGLVCVSGLQLDPELTYLASCVLMGLFVLVEITRITRLKPIGELIDNCFGSFLDDQDQGPLVLTPIYLLASVFIPLWLQPVKGHDVALQHYAGVISVGFGDSFASIVGSQLGRRYWFNGYKKTVEGSLGGILAQVLGIGIACYLVRMPAQILVSQFWGLLCVSVILGMLETFTAQIDNLVLPFVAFLMFGWIV